MAEHRGNRDDRRRDPAAYPFHCHLAVRFGDLDSQAHVNNVSVARYYEEARVRFHIDRLGRAAAARDTSPWSTVVAALNITYLKELGYPATVDVGVGIGRIGRTSFTVEMGLFLKGDCLGLCETVTVIVKDGQPLPLPDDMRAKLEAAKVAS